MGMLAWLKQLVGSETDHVRTARELAERGENLAAKHLQSLGYRILMRNFRCELGEVDLIARDGKTLVFVEVKTREDDAVAPESQVDGEKQQHVVRVARHYLSRYGVPRPPYRFDIVGIVWPPGRSARIHHIPGAFGE